MQPHGLTQLIGAGDNAAADGLAHRVRANVVRQRAGLRLYPKGARVIDGVDAVGGRKAGLPSLRRDDGHDPDPAAVAVHHPRDLRRRKHGGNVEWPGRSGVPRRARWARILSGLESGVVFTLLVVGGLLLRSLSELGAVDPGFDPDGGAGSLAIEGRPPEDGSPDGA